MKRRIIHIALCLVLALAATGQVVSPMGYGLPSTPQQVTDYKSGVAAVYADLYDEIQVQIWNGDFWYKLEQPQLPKFGTNADGVFEIVDLMQVDQSLYLCAAYSTKTTTNAKAYILKWDGQKWTDLTNTIVADAVSISDMEVLNDDIILIGKFQSNSTDYNIVEYSGSDWAPKGNLITQSFDTDEFGTISVVDNKILSTGNFTASSINYSLATWDGEEWKIAEFPAFHGNHITSGTYNDKAVVYGEPLFGEVEIKIQSGNSWQDLTKGLDKYDISVVESFAQVEGSLFAIGDFKETSSNTDLEILEFDGIKWGETDIKLRNITQLHSSKSTVLLCGGFTDNARINYIGEMRVNEGQIAARVYEDKNANSIKDPNEDWLPNYPLTIGDRAEYLQTDKFGQLYLPVDQTTYIMNASSIGHYVPTCDDAQIEVTENKTYYGYVFGVNKPVGISDAGITITDYQSYKSNGGEVKKAQVCVNNPGSQPVTNATVTLDFTTSFSGFTSVKNYDSYADNKATYTVNVVAGGSECWDIGYTVVDEESMKIEAQVNLANGVSDKDPKNNSSKLTYEPGPSEINYKHCDNGKIIEKDETQMHYKIGFKNVGTATVLDAKIVDEFDTDLYFSTKGVWTRTSMGQGVTSITTQEKLQNGNYKNKVVWSFSDINLAPSSVNDNNSTGFLDITVNIVPNVLDQGVEICNYADIYFSHKEGTFDEPLRTNTVCSEIGEKASENPSLPYPLTKIAIYPNPVVDVIHAENNSNDDISIQITTALGQELVNTIVGRQDTKSIDVSNLSSGIYMLYADGIFVKKVVLK